MCVIPGADPVTMAMVAVQAGGAIARGVQTRSTALSNAAALESTADAREEKAEFDRAAAERRFIRQRGAVRAAIGASGGDVSSFSDVLADDAAEAALERKAIMRSAEIDVANLNFQASGQRSQARGAVISSVFDVGSAVAGGYARTQQLRTINARTSTLGGVSLTTPFDAVY